ncbi:MAG: hypothetical protein ACRDF0_06480 [Candidatus Limnocylindria bacterium]
MTRLRALLDERLVISATTLAVALVVAEQLYKFRSFTLEAVAFLATWWALRQAALFIFSRR